MGPNARRRRWRDVAALQAAALLGAAGVAAAADYAPVTDERLAKPEPENWLQYRGNYQGWGFSPLDQVSTENVKELVPVWTLSTGVGEGHQAPPIVSNGVMFVSTPQNQVIAVDARSGDMLWRYQRELPEACSSSTRPTAASGSTATRSTSPRSTPASWRSRPRPGRSLGRSASPIGRTATT